jgi:glycolate oxidase FAD binding subunit
MALDDLIGRIKTACEKATPLRIRGAGSKDFYGGLLAGELLDVSAYRGVVAYEPSELFITAKCATPLAEIEELLAARGQMLAFEPPHFARATVGGCVASGLAGPRRQQAGGVRDFVLGVKLIDGRGQALDFGGQVMKNVAGYDVSRLVAGSMGTLGLIAEVTLKVLPRPQAEKTLAFDCDEATAIVKLNQWGGQPVPVSASFWHAGRLSLRLSGAFAAVEAASRKLGGEAVVNAENLWNSVREQTHSVFAAPLLWRLALPSATPPLPLKGLSAIEWGGAQRWYAGDLPDIRAVAAGLGGHAVLYRAAESQRCREGAFAPLTPGMLALHRRIKKTFDPKGILNPGRLYAEL